MNGENNKMDVYKRYDLEYNKEKNNIIPIFIIFFFIATIY